MSTIDPKTWRQAARHTAEIALALPFVVLSVLWLPGFNVVSFVTAYLTYPWVVVFVDKTIVVIKTRREAKRLPSATVRRLP